MPEFTHDELMNLLLRSGLLLVCVDDFCDCAGQDPVHFRIQLDIGGHVGIVLVEPKHFFNLRSISVGLVPTFQPEVFDVVIAEDASRVLAS